MPADNQLTRWIDDLRARLIAGDLDDLAPFDLGDWTGRLPGAQTVRIMFANLDDLTPRMALPNPSISVTTRYRTIRERFQQLRDLLGAHPHRNGIRTH